MDKNETSSPAGGAVEPEEMMPPNATPVRCSDWILIMASASARRKKVAINRDETHGTGPSRRESNREQA
jgi:hypothetical protein